MKYAILLSLTTLAASTAFAAQTTTTSQSLVPADYSASSTAYHPLTSRIEEESRITDNNGHPYDQLLILEAGPYKPHSVNFSNWNNTSFNYDDSALGSFDAELGWAINMFRLGGTAFYIGENVGFSTYSLKLPDTLLAAASGQSVTLHMFSFDTRITQSWETFPIAALEPFWEGGVRITLWDQSAPSDLLSGEGTTTNFTAGAGLRLWVNRKASLNREFPNRYMALPIFLTAKVNQIFSNNQGVDPGNTTVLGGLSIGL